MSAHDCSGTTTGYGDINKIRDPSNANVLYATTSDRGYGCARFSCDDPYNIVDLH